MLTAMAAGDMLADMRRSAALSVRGLADAANVSPSTVHRIEKGLMHPTVSMLEDLATACGLRLRLRLEPDYSINVGGLAQSIVTDLDASDQSSIIRKVAEFVRTFRQASSTRKRFMVATPPPLTGEMKWDVFLAALVEWLTVSHGLKSPAWVFEVDDLDQAWWVSSMKSLRPYQYAGTPAAFQSRGVYLHRESLENV